jgi:hypothetical protein
VTRAAPPWAALFIAPDAAQASHRRRRAGQGDAVGSGYGTALHPPPSRTVRHQRRTRKASELITVVRQAYRCAYSGFSLAPPASACVRYAHRPETPAFGHSEVQRQPPQQTAREVRHSDLGSMLDDHARRASR